MTDLASATLDDPAAARAGRLLDAGALARLVGGRAPTAPLPFGAGVAYDSRKVRPGDVFFARSGSAGHGVAHADDALAAGAAFIVSDVPHPSAVLVPDTWTAMKRVALEARRCITSPVVGVTGSAGKTTVKTLVTAGLGGRSTPGNLNTVPALLAALVEAARRDAGLDVRGGDLAGPGGPGSPVVLELGIDHPGEMQELLGFTEPDHGLVTTIGESHLSRLGDLASVAREKSGLLRAVDGQRVAGDGAAALLPTEVLKRTCVVRVLDETSGPLELASLPAAEVTGLLDQGRLHAFGLDLALPWRGSAMATNVLLALTMSVRLGVDAREAADRIVSAQLEAGRLAVSELGPIRLIDDSYNSNPLSAAAALDVLRSYPGPHVAFLGDMKELGELSLRRHLELGRATSGLDLVVAIGEEAAAIARENPSATWVADAASAIAELARIPEGATVLVKGSRSLGLETLVTAIRDRFSGRGNR